jgi:two-component sensor histidine kinase
MDFATGERTWSNELRRLFGLGNDTPPDPEIMKSRMRPQDRSHLEQALDAAKAADAEGFFRVEARIERADGRGEGWLLWIGRVFFSTEGRPQRAVAVVLDISDRKEAELRQRVLLDELNHRVKNTLATVQAIAGQTLRRTSDPEAFVRSFEARLLSLSKTHNLLTHSGWRGARLKDILAAELEPFGRGDGARARLSGPELELPARHAVAIGMVLHELTTNAAKYGALSTPEGRVAVTWTIMLGRDSPRTLTLNWQEMDGPPVSPPSREGFGSRLIRRTMEGELSGRVAFDFGPAGLRVSLTVPLTDHRPGDVPSPLEPAAERAS